MLEFDRLARHGLLLVRLVELSHAPQHVLGMLHDGRSFRLAVGERGPQLVRYVKVGLIDVFVAAAFEVAVLLLDEDSLLVQGARRTECVRQAWVAAV